MHVSPFSALSLTGLDAIDSGGPSGSPKEVHIGNALPVEQVLVVLLHNHVLLLHQPKVPVQCCLLFLPIRLSLPVLLFRW